MLKKLVIVAILRLFLVKNQKEVNERTKTYATTDQMWLVDFEFLPGSAAGANYAPEESIHSDGNQSYVWKVENVKAHDRMPADRLLKVSKVPVRLGPTKLPFLGNWVFQQVEFDGADFDPKLNMIAGRIREQGEQVDDWDGDTLLVDNGGQWMLRPGDLVKVNLSAGEVSPGYFVPMDAIAREGDATFLLEVDESSETPVVRRRPVKLDQNTKTTSSIRRIQATSGELDGLRYVSRGVHFLYDGEPVKVVEASP